MLSTHGWKINPNGDAEDEYSINDHTAYTIGGDIQLNNGFRELDNLYDDTQHDISRIPSLSKILVESCKSITEGSTILCSRDNSPLDTDTKKVHECLTGRANKHLQDKKELTSFDNFQGGYLQDMCLGNYLLRLNSRRYIEQGGRGWEDELPSGWVEKESTQYPGRFFYEYTGARQGNMRNVSWEIPMETEIPNGQLFPHFPLDMESVCALNTLEYPYELHNGNCPLIITSENIAFNDPEQNVLLQ